LAAALLFFGTSASAANPCLTAADNAQDLRAANKLREARAALLVCAQKSCNAVVRSDCTRWLREVDEQTPSIVVRALDARGRDVVGVRVTIDDAPIELDGAPVQLDPGQHLVRAKARCGDTAEQKVLVALSEKARLFEVRFDVPLEQDGTRIAEAGAKPKAPPEEKPEKPEEPKPAPPAGPSNVVPLVLTVIGVAALGSFGYFEYVGQSKYSELEDGCAKRPGKCTPEETSPVRAQFVGAGISLGVAAVALVAAAIVHFTRKPSSTAFQRAFTF
jgi:hypothetical protein